MALNRPSSPMLRALVCLYDIPSASESTETEKPLLDELPPLAGIFGREPRKINKGRWNCDPHRLAKVADAETALNKLPAACVLAAEPEAKLLDELFPVAGAFGGAVLKKNKRLQKSNLNGHEMGPPTILVNGFPFASASAAKIETQLPNESSPMGVGSGRALKNRRLDKCSTDRLGRNQNLLPVPTHRGTSCPAAVARGNFVPGCSQYLSIAELMTRYL